MRKTHVREVKQARRKNQKKGAKYKKNRYQRELLGQIVRTISEREPASNFMTINRVVYRKVSLKNPQTILALIQ